MCKALCSDNCLAQGQPVSHTSCDLVCVHRDEKGSRWYYLCSHHFFLTSLSETIQDTKNSLQFCGFLSCVNCISSRTVYRRGTCQQPQSGSGARVLCGKSRGSCPDQENEERQRRNENALDPGALEIRDRWNANKVKNHGNFFLVSDILITLMFVVASDLSEAQRDSQVPFLYGEWISPLIPWTTWEQCP